MKCERVQQQLLSLEAPDQPPHRLRSHLADCAACRDWQRRLLLVERNVALIPVPRSAARLELLRRLLKGIPVEEAPGQAPAVLNLSNGSQAEPDTVPEAQALDTATSRRLEAPAPPPPRGVAARAIWWSIPALTAAVVLLGLGWWLLPGPEEPVASIPAESRRVQTPFLAQLLQSDLRLAAAATPPQRVEVLADMADDLLVETRELSRNTSDADLLALARLYGDVVRKGIVPIANTVSASQERQALQAVADRLNRTARDADVVARVHGGAQGNPLKQIAAAAREGANALRELLREHQP